MAQVSSDGGSDGCKLNTELNLVPFIDLLSSLVLFLLVTSVWLQVGTITVSADSKGRASQNVATKSTLYIYLTSHGYDLKVENTSAPGLAKTIPLLKGEFDQARLIQEVKAKLSNRMPNTAAISSVDNIPYKHVVRAVDAMKTIGFTNVALSTD